MSGYPKPEIYDHYYINKYSYPRGLATYKKADIVAAKASEMSVHPRTSSKSQGRIKKSLYDIKPQVVRTGIAGWKLTKRPLN